MEFITETYRLRSIMANLARHERNAESPPLPLRRDIGQFRKHQLAGFLNSPFASATGRVRQTLATIIEGLCHFAGGVYIVSPDIAAIS